MDPLSGLGAAASITQLLALCAKSAIAAKELWESYAGAPTELRELAEKLEFLRCSVEQIHAFGAQLSTENIDELLPVVYRATIMATLQERAAQLEGLKSLKRDHHAFGAKMRWAMLDKAKATRILRAVADTERDLHIWLAIAQARLQTLNQTYLRHLLVVQAATMPALETVSLQIQSCVNTLSENSTLVQRDIHALQTTMRHGLAENNTKVEALAQVIAQFQSSPNVEKQGHSFRETIASDDLGISGSDSMFDTTTMEQSRYLNQIIAQHSWACGNNADGTLTISTTGSSSKPSSTPQQALGAAFQLQRKRHEKKLRAKVRAWFNFFGPKVVDFEFAIRIRSKAWMSPSLEFRVNTINIRPASAPIFQACLSADLKQVKLLLESGEASINDVSEKGHSLLSHVLSGGPMGVVGQDQYPKASSILMTVRYLLTSGCDPNLGTRSPFNLALFDGRVKCARLLLRAGADLYSEAHETPDSRLVHYDNQAFKAEMDLLRSENYWNWTPKILSAASATGIPEYVMQVVDLLQLPVSIGEGPFCTAAPSDNIEVLSILLHLRAKGCFTVDRAMTEARLVDHVLEAAILPSDQVMIQYLLLKSGNPAQYQRPAFRYKLNVSWYSLWIRLLWSTEQWRFQELEGLLLHLLLHEDPDQLNMVSPLDDLLPDSHAPVMPRGFPWMVLSVGKYDRGVPHPMYLTLHEVSQLWSLCESRNEGNPNEYAILSEFIAGRLRKPSTVSIRWSARGLISKHRPMCRYYKFRYRLRTEDIDEKDLPKEDCSKLELDRDTAHLLESNPSVGVSAIKMAVQRSQDNRDSPHYPHRFRRDDDGRDEIPFDDTTLFYENISTERGRRQMSDFPMVRVFCNALQLAGYRAEMDDEGDIWYDADDGDRYHDAREYQPGPGKDNGVVADCAICRDPEKHGLGYILRRAEAGERFITEFWERDKGKHKSRF